MVKKTKKKVVALALAFATAFTTCPNYGLISRLNASDEEVAVESEIEISDSSDEEIITTEFIPEEITEISTEDVVSEEVTEDTEDNSEDQTEDTEEISTEDLDTSSEENTEADTEEATEENTDEPTEEAEENSEENTEEEEVSYPEWMNNYSDEDFIRIFGIEKAEFDNVAKDVTIAQGQSYSYDGYNSAYYSVSGINSKVYRTSSFLLNGGSVLKAVPVKDNSFIKALYFSYGGPGFMNSDLRTTIKEMEIDNIDAVNALSEKALNETFKNIYFPESASGLQFGVNTVEYGNYASGFNTYLLIDENDGNIKGYYFTPYTEVSMEDILEDDGEEEEKETWFDRYSDEEFFNLFGCFKEEWEEKASDIQVSVGEAYSFDGYSSNYYTVPNGKMYKLGDYNITSDGTYKSVPVTKPEVTKTLYYVYGSDGYNFGIVPASFYHEEELINTASINATSEKVIVDTFNRAYFGNGVYDDYRTSFIKDVINGFTSAPSSVKSFLVVDDNIGDIVGVYVTPYVTTQIGSDSSTYSKGGKGVINSTVTEKKKDEGLLSFVSRTYNALNPNDWNIIWSKWSKIEHNLTSQGYRNFGDFMAYYKYNQNIYSQAYCVDHAEQERTGSGSPSSFTEENYENTRKILYYGFRNEKTEDGTIIYGAKYPYMSAATEGMRQYSIIIMSLALDTVYNGVQHQASKAFYNWAISQPSVPKGSLEFTRADGSSINGNIVAQTYIDYERGGISLQATDWIKVSGSDTLQAKIENLPDKVSIYKLNENGTTTITDSSTIFKNGDMFFLATPSVNGYEGGYSTKLKYVESPYTAYIASYGPNTSKPGHNYQRTANILRGETENAGFGATFNKAVGSVEVRKETTRHDLTDYNGEYEYKGAEYAIFNSTTIVGQIIIDETGYGRADNIPVGDYVIQETKAPKGFKLDPNMYPITITANNTFTFSPSQPGTISGKLPEQPAFYGDILIKKIEAKTQNETPLPGAIFVVKYFKGQYSTNPEGTYPMERFWFFKSGDDGYVKYDQNHFIQNYNGFTSSNLYDGGIPAGTITIQEITPPVDHKADSTVYVRNLYSSYDGISKDWNIEYQYVTIENEPNYMDPADIVIYKVSDDPDVDTRFLKGAEYKVTHYDELFTTYDELTSNGYTPSLNTDSKERVWTLTTDEDGIAKLDIDHKVSGPEFDLDSSNKPAFPMGTLVIEETKAPNGFLLDNTKHVVVWDTASNKYITETISVDGVPTEAYVKSEEPNDIPGKIGVYKVGNKRTYDPVTGTLKTEVVELDGIKFDIITNQNVAIPVTGGLLYFRAGSVVETITTGSDGYAETTRKLPMGTYTIREQDSKYWIEADDRTVTLSHKDIRDDLGDDYIVYHVENITNMPIIPEISTTATVNGIHLAKPSSNTVITDKVKLEKLIVGDEYTISGTLMDKNTKKHVVKNGLPVVATKKFTATSENEIQTLEYTFDSTGMEDAAVVVFERLYNSDGELVALHEDINDDYQTVNITRLRTKAVGKDSNTNVIMPKKDLTVVDTIYYKNLIPGKEYKISGKLMNKNTNSPLLVNGMEVVAEKKFTPATKEGTVELEFVFDASDLQGETIVVFETLYFNEIEVGAHADITDEEQTLFFPAIKTLAKDSKTQTHTSLAEKEVKIIDQITYENLVSGKEYEIKGTIYDKSTGKALVVNDKNVTSSKKFVPDSPNGTVDMEFTFDASQLKGKTVVVFEDLYLDGKLVATHSDITDANQSIEFPNVSTTATEKTSGLHITKPAKVTVVDKVQFTNLNVGTEYTVNGTLRFADSGEVVKHASGIPVVGSTTFIAETKNGTVDVEFTFDATLLENKTVVVFESLYVGEKLIAAHNDLKDENQSVHFPEVKTTARDSETQTNIMFPSKETVIIDKVSYKNLIPNKEYKVSGVLMNKDTNKPLLVDGKEITAEKKFTPSTADGFVELEFKFDGSALQGETVVVFERLYHNNIEVGVHADITDEEQSVKTPLVKTKAVNKETATNEALADGKAVIVDEVSYENVLANKEYTVVGKLYDRITGKPIMENGKEIVAETKFVANSENGTVNVEFTIENASALKGKTLVVFEDLYYNGKIIGTHSDLTDANQTIYFPEVSTTARDKDSEMHIAAPNETITIIDSVEYKNLKIGKKYIMSGILMDKGTNEPFLVDGKEIRSEKEFIPETENGIVDIEFTFDGSLIEGQTLVVFEDLIYDNKSVAIHHDINDEGQTVHYSKVRTTAVDEETRLGIAFAGDSIKLIDSVKAENLIPDLEYVIKGIVMDKETGEPLLVNGETIEAQAAFIAKSENETVDVEFTLDGASLKNKTLVIFEEVYCTGRLIGYHKDINDEGQTIHIPEIGTTATSDNGTHVGDIAEEITITDKVSYSNLIPGKTYTVKGVLMDSSTNEPLLVDGKEIRAEKTFIPEEASGYVELEFTFNSSALIGKVVVVFEDLYIEEKQIATHADITDEDQTIYFASIKTLAKDENSGSHMAVPGESVTIVDTISYENLVPDLEYEIRGYMMVKQTGEKLVVNGKEVTATKKFTPTSSSGTVDVSYTFDARELGRKTLVVFEEVYLNGELVAKHKDINDEGQTVRITSCGTKARGKDTDLQTILPFGTKTIIDYVEYHNLIVGYTYRVNGVLMDKATNKPLLDKDGNEITASKEFVAETSDGVVELEFTFDASLLIDKVAVAFESVTYNEKEIAVHADINDEEQTIYFPSIDTVATESTSNTHYGSVGGDVTIVDMVSLKSVQPGTEVVIKGVLMDKATGNPVIIDGKEVRAEKTVNVDSSSLTASMSYTFNTASLNGKTLVCYETVYLNGTVIAVHEDINDADQSVTFSDQPKTGDNTNILLIVVIAITALAGLVCMIVLKKKKFNSQ